MKKQPLSKTKAKTTGQGTRKVMKEEDERNKHNDLNNNQHPPIRLILIAYSLMAGAYLLMIVNHVREFGLQFFSYFSNIENNLILASGLQIIMLALIIFKIRK
jgi:hypothetical protein